MHRCLALAENGRGRTGINPLVGSVLVRGGSIIAEGWHSAFGADHAERDLFKKFDQEISQEDLLYINLEPCNHHGKTPPCTELILERGVRRVVFGMFDPNPLVAGQGIQRLRNEGVEVIGPVERARCEWLNRGFISLMQQQRPWVTLKRAQTPDGRIAQEDGSPLRITSREQDAWSHAWLRAAHDAILVGIETIIRDDPQMKVRLKNKKVEQCTPLRIVLDPKCRVPMDAQIIGEGTCIVTAQDSEVPSELEERGVQVLRIPFDGKQFDFCALWKALTTPKDDFFGITSVLVEGGPRTWERFRQAGGIDEDVILVGRAS
ncbi:MAG: bifunctional diaminohydroxyphosphoribosylaminopyrimidine deaminase/5-amino-6-(5-phosphoribosylamino)uracil reductase RibD [Candidatus Peribacteraceae bacterium]|nr:bifunctional diaminohydroxyphosphoribosylaminopyrimidine deaminase/5-amino-6-(5-phosphoribosylamino)uracil reductase RibD [Candidatus Peribacteraceae bacterium]